MDNSRDESIRPKPQSANKVSEKSPESNTKQFSIEAPSVSLPKGGGAIKKHR